MLVVSLRSKIKVSRRIFDGVDGASQIKPTIAKKVAEAMVAVRDKEPKPQPKCKLRVT